MRQRPRFRPAGPAALAAFAALALAATAAPGATFTVTNTADTGAGSLRQAIADVNGSVGPHTINFNIPGADPGCDASGVCTIAPTSFMGNITQTVLIDGYSQPGSAVNTLALGTNAVLKVVLSAANVSNQACFGITGTTTVRGIVFSGFWNYAVESVSGTGTHVTGCFFGIEADGVTPNQCNTCLTTFSDDGMVVGGPAPADRNLFGAANNVLISLDQAATNVTVQNNLLGSDRTGTIPLHNTTGISVSTSSPPSILGNVVNGNNGPAIAMTGGGFVRGNKIGTDPSGTIVLKGGSIGIFSNNFGTIGGPDPGDGNVVAGNNVGIRLAQGGDGNVARGNSVFGNTSLGIDNGPDGATPNDPGDADTTQNFPVLKSVATGATTHVVAVLHSKPSKTFDVDFFSNPSCSNFPRDFDEGHVYLGTTTATTDGAGTATIDVTLPVATESGARITMTATDQVGGSTSEFSQRLPFSVLPASGPAGVGVPILVKGTDFAAGAAVTIGGQPVTGVSVTDSNTITGTSPVLTPGTVNDLVVANTDGTAGTLVKGWVSDFLDVPGGQQFYAFVTTLVSNTITVGVGGGMYGIDQPTLRQQMAVFLLKAEHGLCYVPPACSGVFTDVPCSSNFAPWIERMAAEGITGGCGTGVFCPQNPVRRDQMAVFLLKTEHGSAYVPPACAGLFPDVPCSSPFAPWIEQLFNENVTGGCGGGNYCPSSNNTRGQMAVFMVKTFHLQ